ncbi:uncharacterized protein LOC117585119 [Drosophila guanche]|uniref:uncharacterized protein LOC117585119 n=1 Tax=Drosophila guanche TaxID=7266 RepID=UPI0014710B29|nr:uncharacterized protein LOC117585119 [Drosophila guanche]
MRLLAVLFLELLAMSTVYGQDNCDNECKLLEYEKALPNALAVYEYQTNIKPPTFPHGPVNSSFIPPKSRFDNARTAACRVATLIKPKKSVSGCKKRQRQRLWFGVFGNEPPPKVWPQRYTKTTEAFTGYHDTTRVKGRQQQQRQQHLGRHRQDQHLHALANHHPRHLRLRHRRSTKKVSISGVFGPISKTWIPIQFEN